MDYQLDIAEPNARWERGYGEDEVWGQMIISETASEAEVLTAAPVPAWRLDEAGHVSFVRPAPGLVVIERRVRRPSSCGWPRRRPALRGSTTRVLVTRGHLQTDDYQLTERCRRWIAGIRRGSSHPVTAGARSCRGSSHERDQHRIRRPRPASAGQLAGTPYRGGHSSTWKMSCRRR